MATIFKSWYFWLFLAVLVVIGYLIYDKKSSKKDSDTTINTATGSTTAATGASAGVTTTK